MRPVMSVTPATSSFEQLWSSLASSVGADFDLVAVPDAQSLRRSSLLVISAGGAESDAARLLVELRKSGWNGTPPVAIAGSVPDHRLSINLIKHGADNYFALPAELAALRSWIVEQVERTQAVTQRASFTTHQRAQYDYSRLIGTSDALRRVLDLTTRITPHREAPVLLTGETGTGKELIARAIHYNGADADKPFVEINCSAIPGHLLEAELFGYERGAFTDARSDKPGLLEIADSGTVFLDEIGEMHIDLQAKLLRVLEDKKVRRLGGTISREIKARIIAATHVDLQAAVQAHKFREDLYYRLNVFRIALPPLRERREDIEPLAEHFRAHFARRYGLNEPQLDANVRAMLRSHTWPGNVRELKNAIERSLLLGPDDAVVSTTPVEGSRVVHPLPFPAEMETIQRAAAVAMVAHCRNNKSAAAEALGISRKRLYVLLNVDEASGNGNEHADDGIADSHQLDT